MLNTLTTKKIYAAAAIAFLSLAASAAVIVDRSAEKADAYFDAVVQLGESNEDLLRSVTSTIAFMNHAGDDQEDFARSARKDINHFHDHWRDFRSKYSKGHPGISELFDDPVNIDEHMDEFLALAYSIIAPSSRKSQLVAYHSFLRLARDTIQALIAETQRGVQKDYALARQQMHMQLKIAMAAILALLLAIALLARRTIAAWRAARDAAESASKTKSEFLSTMSHEIRTPMTGVLGMAELLQRTELTEKQKLYVSTIVGSGEALTTIINDLLDLAKISAGKMTVRAQPFDLAGLVEDIAMLLSPRAAEQSSELTVRVQPGLPSDFIGDAGHIRQVIINLAGNAIKFTRNGTVLVDISGKTANGSAKLTIAVEDTGIGIPADRLSRIFDQFEQVEQSAPRKASTYTSKGTGLGLAICSKLVKLMGGDISVASEEGKGSRFSVTLDLPIDPEAETESRPPLDVAGARILVVDDNAINRTVAVEQLESRSLNAEAVDSADAALRRLRDAADANAPYHLAMLDHHMPVMDGLELAATIRKDPKLGDLPILMMTSITMSDDDDTFRAMRIDGHLPKPARASLMFETIVNILRRGQSSLPTETDNLANPATGDIAIAMPRRTAQLADMATHPRRHDPRGPHLSSGRR